MSRRRATTSRSGALITAIAPWSLGTTYPGGEPQWAAGTHIVEALSYVGAATLLLALVGLAAVRAGREPAAQGRLGLPRRRDRPGSWC